MEVISDHSSDSDSENSWIETSEIVESETLCLFCNQTINSPELIFDHCLSEHHFSFSDCVKQYAPDAVSFIKLVNFIRCQKPLPSEIMKILPLMHWQSDAYMKPVIKDDKLLTFDIETYTEINDCHKEKVPENDTVEKSFREYNLLVEELKLCRLQLEQWHTDMDQMRQAMQNLILAQEPDEKLPKMEEDDEYFSSYAHHAIHHEMLQDKTRTEAYKSAIMNNANTFANKTVLDVGCGTAILSMFCASAGAKKVIGIDESDVVYQAMQIVRENNLEKIIDLQKGRIEDATLPVNKVDIIVSEWMGYFLLYEDMIDSIMYARNYYLISDGLIFPNRCTMSLVAVSDMEIKKKYIDFWEDVYGYKMTCMKKDVIEEAIIEVVNTEKICSKPAIIKELNLLTCIPQDTEFRSQFQLELLKEGPVTALAGYFDCYFDDQLTTPVHLSTSPLSKPTHWKQTIFLLSSPITAKKGDILQGRILCRRSPRERRSLVITINIGSNNTQTYFLK